MHNLKTAIIITTVLLLCSSSLMLANATSYYYQLSNDVGPGGVQLGDSVTITATTNNGQINKIRFTLTGPLGVVETVTKSVSVSGSTRSATYDYTPDASGTWTVKAEYLKGTTCYSTKTNSITIYAYTLTNNAGSGGVQLDDPVTVTATTNNGQIDKVRFTWFDPTGTPVFTETKSVSGSNHVATSTFTPNALGDWIVKADFLDKQGCCCCCSYKTLETRTTSFNVVPEVPLIGTAGIAVAMVLGLAFYKKRALQ
ncbi:MAG: hypothetical protein ACQCN3_04680 [Candidatus Bathyarchaeia archaeon]